MNKNDSEYIAGILNRELGYEVLWDANPKDVDLVFINTCFVRGKVKNKIYSIIGKLEQIKRKKKDFTIGVGGCMAQVAKDEILQEEPAVDFVIGTSNLYKIGDVLRRLEEKKEIRDFVEEEFKDFPEGLPIYRETGVNAWITIIRGCNNFCTYCIVPYTRGREISRRPEYILREIDEVISKGFREITLLGQNVNSYGHDLEEDVNFAWLLRTVAEKYPNVWINFITSHPKDFSNELIEVISTHENITRYIHLPVQAGSNEVLRRMNRGYTREEYIRLIEKIREKVKDVSISTDVMVGFPGETDKDFEDTLSLFRKIRFDSAFTFVYSDRKGTAAYNFKDKIPEKIKKERIKELIELQNKITEEVNRTYIGKEVEALIEKKPSRAKEKDEFQARTKNNKIVIVKGDLRIKDKVIVRIEELLGWTFKGKVIRKI